MTPRLNCRRQKTFVGQEFVSEMDHFFASIGRLQQGISVVSETFIERLESSESKLCLIFTPAKDKIAEAEFLYQKISDFSYQVDEYIMNRSYSPELDQSEELSLNGDEMEHSLYNYFTNEKQRNIKMLEEVRKNLNDEKMNFSYLPEIKTRLSDQRSLFEFSHQVFQSWEGLS